MHTKDAAIFFEISLAIFLRSSGSKFDVRSFSSGSMDSSAKFVKFCCDSFG